MQVQEQGAASGGVVCGGVGEIQFIASVTLETKLSCKKQCQNTTTSKQLTLASQRFPVLLVHVNFWPCVCKIRATLWGRCGQPGSPQPMGHGMVSSHRACLRLLPYCGGWYGFPLLLKLLITALGSSTRAFHSCSPCGLLQHGFLVEQMGYYVESYCIFVSLIFIYLFHCLSF